MFFDLEISHLIIKEIRSISNEIILEIFSLRKTNLFFPYKKSLEKWGKMGLWLNIA